MLLVVACGSDPDAGQGDTSAAPTDATGGKPSRDAQRGTRAAAPNADADGGADSNDTTEPDEEPGESAVPPGWTPANLAPEAWYVASASDYQVVSGVGATWRDRQNNGHDLTQSVGWAQPQLVTAEWNGAPTVRFNGSNLLNASWSGSPPMGTNAGFTVLAVMRLTPPVPPSLLAAQQGIAAWWSEWGDGVWASVRSTSGLALLDYHRLDDGTLTQMYAGNQDLGTTGGHVVAWRFSPSTQTVSLTVDGAHAVSTHQPPVGNITPMPLIVGATSPLPTGFFKGDISELVIVGDAISDAEIQDFTEYAQNTWNLSTSPGSGPCIKADDGQPSPETIRCDDGNPETFGDHCSAGSCIGTVPGPGSPKDLSPVAWYHAGESEVVITHDGVSTWFDRSPEHRDLLNGYSFRPDLVADGWAPNKPTVRFVAPNALKRNGWAGAPTGAESAFTVLAVLRPNSVPSGSSSGVVSWWHPGAYGQVACQIKGSGSTNALDLYRFDISLTSQDFVGNVNLPSARHVVAWRYGNGTSKLTVDGVTQTQPHSHIGAIPSDWFLMGVASGYPTGIFSGDISELAVIPGSISDTEVANFTAYAQAEWGGLTIACTPDCADKALGDEDGCGGNCGCDLSAPFDAPVAAFTGSMDADGLTFSADGLTAYISGAGPGDRDIYVTTRPSPEGTFSTPTLVTAVNTGAIERAPSLSPDGKLYFTKQPSSMLDIGRAVGTASQFTGAEVVPAPVSSAYQDEDPFWWGNNTLYFVSEVDNGGTHRDIWMATLSGTTFLPPTKVQGQLLNSSTDELRPVLSPDGLTLYFASKRHGIGSDTQGDVWMARRTSTSAAFLPPVNLWGMNSTGTDYPVTVSANGCTLYFASNEETGLGASQSLRLYQATRGTSTTAQVTLRLNILGQGSVTTPPFNCGPGNTGTCSASAPPDATMILVASGLAQWTGSCTGNGGTPSSDGVVVFSQDAVCTVKFPGAGLVGQGGLCSLSMDCAQGLPCVNNVCGCVPGVCSAQCPCGPGGSCDEDTDCQSGLECNNGACGCAPGTPCGAGCGDAIRDPVNEECDDGPGNAFDACASDCRLTDLPAAPLERVDGVRRSRTLGYGRHPLAAGTNGSLITYSELQESTSRLKGALFRVNGQPLALFELGADADPSWFADASVAAIGPDRFVAAWNDLGRGSLDVAMRLVQAAALPVNGDVVVANSVRAGAQQDPDLVWTGSELIVAWSSEFVIQARRFDADLAPVATEQQLGFSGEMAGSVSLARFGGTWAAAWRVIDEDGGELLRIHAGDANWSVGPFLPGAEDERPALVELDPSNLLLVFTEGTDPLETGTAAVTRLRGAVLNVDVPGVVDSFPLANLLEPYASDDTVAQRHPTLARVGSRLFFGWETETLSGSSLAAELWLQELGWSTDDGLVQQLERPIQVTTAREASQRAPAFAASPLFPQGALALAWEEHAESWPYGSRPDIVFALRPVPFITLP